MAAITPLSALTVDAIQNQGDGIGWLDFDNAATTTKYHCVLVDGSGDFDSSGGPRFDASCGWRG